MILGTDFTLFLTRVHRRNTSMIDAKSSFFTCLLSPLTPGAAVVYTGTDFLVLDEGSGLIREDYIALDDISV